MEHSELSRGQRGNVDVHCREPWNTDSMWTSGMARATPNQPMDASKSSGGMACGPRWTEGSHNLPDHDISAGPRISENIVPQEGLEPPTPSLGTPFSSNQSNPFVHERCLTSGNCRSVAELDDSPSQDIFFHSSLRDLALCPKGIGREPDRPGAWTPIGYAKLTDRHSLAQPKLGLTQHLEDLFWRVSLQVDIDLFKTSICPKL